MRARDFILETADQGSIDKIIGSFVSSPSGQKYAEHDCKTVTRAFVQWAKSQGIPTQVIVLAPPSAAFIKKNPQFQGKSGKGDQHIMPIVNGRAIDFTVRQFGVNMPFEQPLVTPVEKLPSVYGRFGYFTDRPPWFLGGKTHWIGPLNQIPKEIFNQEFGDEILEQGVQEGTEEINWVKPNFDFEWHEVEEQSKMKQVPIEVRQYYQKHFPNKEAWLKSVQNGRVVTINPDHNFEIRNAPYDKESLMQVLAPTGHEGPIGPAKQKRVNALFDKGGPIEMPIILKTNKGLWLIGGKTRLGTANYIKGIPAKVWMISGEQGVAEGVTQDFFNKNFSQIDSVITKQYPKEILNLLLGMFPNAKEAIVNQYNDEEGMPFSEWRRVIYEIDDYVLSGPVVVNGSRLPIDPESEADRLAKYQQYIQDKDSGRPARYFRANDSDPRTIDFSKLPPITIAQTDQGMEVTDGNHRAFLAKMANKPLRAYVWKRQSNNHPNVAKIKALFSNQQGVREGSQR